MKDDIKQVIQGLPVNGISTPELMAAVMAKVPEAEPEDIASALVEIAEQNQAEANRLRRVLRMRKANITGVVG